MRLNTVSKRSLATQLSDILTTDLIADAESNKGLLRSYRVIARDYDTSINTVHHAVKALVKQGVFATRKGIGTYLQTGYRKRLATMRRPRRTHIAVIFSDLADAYAWMNPFIAGITAYQRSHAGFSFSVHYLRGTDIEDDVNAQIHDYLMKGFCDGVILMCPVIPKNIRMMQKYHIRFVALFNDYAQRIDTVHADSEQVYREISAVMTTGRRTKLLLIVNNDLNSRTNRFCAGFERHAKGAAFAVRSLQYTGCSRTALASFMKKNSASIAWADAVFTIGDEAAMACREHLRTSGREKSTIIINYTDYNYTVAEHNIMKQGVREIHTAIELLIDQIRNPEHKPARHIVKSDTTALKENANG
ncbi:MAG: hypothetical protein AABZ39_00425 [Spirochaetota bacterium]